MTSCSPARRRGWTHPAYFAAGDVFCMPTRTRKAGFEVEGLGIVYLEASACGLPVVAGDSGGAPDAVQDGVTGYVVNGRATDEIADRVSTLLLDRKLATRWGVGPAVGGAAMALGRPGTRIARASRCPMTLGANEFCGAADGGRISRTIAASSTTTVTRMMKESCWLLAPSSASTSR